MIRHLVATVCALLAGSAHAAWVELSDPLAFDKPPPVWCNAQRTACAISRQPYGASGALRIALTVAGTPDCKFRRVRYVYVRRAGDKDGDLARAQEMNGNTCLLDIPLSQIEGMRSLQFSVPMLTQDSVLMELPLDGLDSDRLAKNRP